MCRSRWADIARCAIIVLLLGRGAAASLSSCEEYGNNEDIDARLAGYETSFPHLARREIIGQSVAGADIHALFVSTDPAQDAAKPEVRVVGGIHGNECLATEMVLQIIASLLDGAAVDPMSRRLVEHLQFVFVPLVNPDGHDRVPAERLNASGIDLNRNFGYAWTPVPDHGSSPFSEPETRALRDLSQSRAFVLGLSYHTRADYVNGPWNWTPFHPRDEELIAAIGADYAGASDYQVVFGWDWYQISGDIDDWSLGTAGTFDWTIELQSDAELQWDVHGPGVVAFFEWALRGVEGTVTDAETGQPLPAMITVEPEGEPVFTDPDGGDYHRMLLEGTYEITAWANGYAALTVDNVVVPSGGTVTVDFALTPDDCRSAFRVNAMTQPRDLTNHWYATNGYDNTTLPSDALGRRDDWYYSLGGGSLTLDLGEALDDGDGADLTVVSGTGSSDQVRVFVAAHQDGPFMEVAKGAGTLEVDVQAFPRAVQFVRLVDDGAVFFGVTDGGYDVDAVEVTGSCLSDGDPDTDSGTGDTDTPDSADPSSTAHAISGCSTSQRQFTTSLFEVLF